VRDERLLWIVLEDDFVGIRADLSFGDLAWDKWLRLR
jgi:hypothetical protein